MSATAENVKNISTNKRIAESHLRGRILQVRRVKTGQGIRHFTLLIMPAADEFTSPSTVEVSSVAKLGDKNEEVDVTVKIGGYRRSYNSVDKETGESVTVMTSNMSLTAIE